VKRICGRTDSTKNYPALMPLMEEACVMWRTPPPHLHAQYRAIVA
jgi:hypothetical protein